MGEERQRQPHFEDDEEQSKEEPDDTKLLSRYGIWLLVELCKPKEDVPVVRLQIIYIIPRFVSSVIKNRGC